MHDSILGFAASQAESFVHVYTRLCIYCNVLDYTLLHTYIPTYILRHTDIHTYVRTYIYVNIYVYLPTIDRYHGGVGSGWLKSGCGL